MKKQLQYKDEALVLKKIQLKDAHQSISLLTKQHGKLVLTAFGSKRLTSKRLSHLETGNVLAISWREDGEFRTLQETDLLYAHSKIKESETKLDTMYAILFIVNKLSPEAEPSESIFKLTLETLKRLHTSDFVRSDVGAFLTQLLLNEGYISPEEVQKAGFDPFRFSEDIMGKVY